MARNTQHELLTSPSPDIRARQRFVLALKRNGEQLRRRFVSKADAVADLLPGSSDTRLEDAITSLYSENA